jgi:hypothetical protein
MDSTYSQAMIITNNSKKPVMLAVEFWGWGFTLEPKAFVKIVGVGGEIGENFEIAYDDGTIIVYGWSDSLVDVYDGENAILPGATVKAH